MVDMCVCVCVCVRVCSTDNIKNRSYWGQDGCCNVTNPQP